MEVTWNRNSLLGLEELDVNEINLILELSKEFKENLSKKAETIKKLGRKTNRKSFYGAKYEDKSCF